jgi:acetoin:2,6-dichlorophenolindophenol oxidoreductase subunit alpha
MDRMKIDMTLLHNLYEVVYTIRRFEEHATEQYRLGNIRGYLHLYIGEEAIAAGTILALRNDDYITSTHRGHGHAIAKGHDLRLMFAELMGKETGYCKGYGGSMHIANLEQGNLGANGIVGGGIPIATGAGMGIKQKGLDRVVLCFFSDGALNNGVFHESLNLAAIYDLPVIYVLENNHFAVSSSIEKMTHVKDLTKIAEAYGIPGVSVDGNDAIKIFEAIQDPISRARKGKGPTLFECKTYRHGGHHVNDPGLYMPKDVLENWKAKDPIIVMRNHLLNKNLAEKEIQAIHEKIEKLLNEAVKFAIESPEPLVNEFLAEVENYI